MAMIIMMIMIIMIIMIMWSYRGPGCGNDNNDTVVLERPRLWQ